MGDHFSGILDTIPQGAYVAELQRVLREVLDELLIAVGADCSFVYWVTPSQTFVPILASGVLTEVERKAFFDQRLDPSTDMLAYQVLAQRTTITSNMAQKDTRIIPSILNQLAANTALAIPVLNAGQIRGLVLVTRKFRFDPFTMRQTRLAEAISVAISLALENVQLYHETQSRLEESQTLHEITLALLQKLELEEVLQMVCSDAQRLTSAQGSSIALLENENWLKIMYCSGVTPEKPGRVSVNQSLLGLAVRRSEPLIINNVKEEQNPAGVEGPVSLLALPLIVQGKVIGVLDVVNKMHGFTERDVDLIQLYANEAAIAVENARLARQVQEMAVVEERYRLSRELHDSVNQLLYGISLYAQAAQRQFDLGDTQSARSHLAKLNETAQEALNEMRLLIFELRPKVLEQMGLKEALEQRLKSVEERLGLEAALKWRVNTHLDARVEEALYGIAQEALNNIVKHSRAKNVTIHLIQSGQALVMKIEDDGTGFLADQASSGGIGLKTMQERAASLKANLEIKSRPEKGTSIIVEVKL
jgi:signal transduction histidine kinase